MGEEKKESGGGHSVKEDNEKQKSQDKQGNNEVIVIKVDMHCHCEACAKKIARALRASQGVEDVAVDRKTNTVVVKGKTAEPMKLCDRIRHKTGRNAHLLSPLPKIPEEQPKDDDNKDQHQQQQQQQLQQKANQPPPVVTVVLGAPMHCEACAQLLRKRIRKMKGVESVETDVGKGEVKVKGVIADPDILVKYVHKKTKKQVSLLSVNNNKDGEEQGKGKGKSQDNISEQKNKAEEDKKEEKGKQDNVDDSTSGVVKNYTINDQQDAKMMMMMMDEINRYDNFNYWPSSSARYDYTDQYHHPQYFHHDNNISNLNNYQPQIFSDENPNACSIM